MPELDDVAGRVAELALRVGIAAVVIVGFVVAARLTLPLVRRVLDRRHRPSYTRVFAGLYRVTVVLVGSLFALTVAFPSVRVADVLAIFGIVSVAAGFAFKDTFENLLAGVLLLLRDPFMSGDQVRIADHDGTVEGVTVRETLLRGHDGRGYYIPNALVMTGVIEVETERDVLRQSFPVSVDMEADLDVVRTTIVDALRRAAGVMPEPVPDAVLTDTADGTVTFSCRFWTGSQRSAMTTSRDSAIGDVVAALVERRIPAPRDELRVTLADGDHDGRHAAS